jgi:hypothetical protein
MIIQTQKYDEYGNSLCPNCNSHVGRYNGTHRIARKYYRQYICCDCKTQYYENRTTNHSNTILQMKGKVEVIEQRRN